MTISSITVLRDTDPQPAGLVWENPPDRKTKTGKYAGIAAALRERPGQWAVLRTYPHDQAKRGWGFVGTIHDGKLVDFPAGEFEACARTVDAQVRVYVRYTGSPAVAR